jgi:hypothetical protein
MREPSTMMRMNRLRRASHLDIEPLEQRALLSAGAGGAVQTKQALATIKQVIKKQVAHEGHTPQAVASGNYLATVVQNDLTYEGFFNSSSKRSSHHGRGHARMVSLSLSADSTPHSLSRLIAAGAPPTEAQTVAAFQAAYKQALIQSGPAAAQMLVADAALAISVYSGTRLLIEAYELGHAYAIGALSKEFLENYENMEKAIDLIMENPLFETPAGQELALTGEEIALSQLVEGQPINLPTPPLVGNPPLEIEPIPETPVYIPPLPARIVVDPQSLTFTTSQGTNPETQTIAISNGGGGSLHLNESTNVSWLGLINEGNSIDGAAVLVGVQVNTALLSPGTYTGTITVSAPEAPNGAQIVFVTLNVTAPVFRGSFTGTVANNDAADGGNDPGGSFVDPYGGAVSMTVTQVTGGYTLMFQGRLTNPSAAEEDFSANFNIHVTVPNLSNIRFTTPMGDGQLLVQGAILSGTFSGTWVFQQTDPNDSSDSGSGRFSLST